MDDPNLIEDRKMQSAKEVAEVGYRAMMKGKPVAIPGFKNAFLAFAVRFLPREFITKMARKIQEGKHL
jgi:short-subunit dehydrogenase